MKKKPQPRVLIVDDEKNTREGLERALRRHVEVELAESGEAALALLDERPVDIVLSDIRMPGMDGIALMQRVLARNPQPTVILLTAYGSVPQAVEAMRLGAFDFLTKPVNLDHLEITLQRALRSRRVETENRSLREQINKKYSLDHIVGNSRAMEEVFDMVQQVAPARTTVLIEGESGTGKELIARAVHQLSPRQHGPFVAVHCAGFNENLLESELFGHEKGAFTGAQSQRKGRFELADGGTLFLDEIGEIDRSTQVKILRVLEERSFERVGGSETVEVDVRLVAATNKTLRDMVDEGAFREDLFFRLNVVRVRLPPLRQRGEDVPLLVNHFLGVFVEENGKPLDGVTPEAMDALCAYDWPGNIRELRNVVERMVVLARGDKLTLRDVPPDLKPGRAGRAGGGGLDTAVTMDDAEKQMIVQALETNGGNRTKAAEQLGISRRTLHRKLNEYGLRSE